MMPVSKRLIRPIGALIVLSIVSATGGVVAASSPEETPQLENALRFRTAFGFDADTELVKASLADGTGFPNTDWGVPLSAVEAAEMLRRLEVREAIVPGSEYAITQPEYGGVYIDQKNGGRPAFLFSSKIPQQALRARVESSA